MIRLPNTTSTLQIVLAGAKTTNHLRAYASFYDIPAQTKPTFEEYRGATAHKESNDTTDVTLVAAPAINGVVRMIDYVAVHNADTAAATVTVKVEDTAASPTEVPLFKKQLAAGETVTWSRGGTWQIL